MLLGIGVSWLKELISIGVIFIEAIVFMLAYDWLVEIWSIYFYQIEYTLPTSEITYWHAWTILFAGHALGLLIGKITPKLVSVSSSSNSSD